MSQTSERGSFSLFFNEPLDQSWTAEIETDLRELYRVIALVAENRKVPFTLDISDPHHHCITLEPLLTDY